MKIRSYLTQDKEVAIALRSESSHEETLLQLLKNRPTTTYQYESCTSVSETQTELVVVFGNQHQLGA